VKILGKLKFGQLEIDQAMSEVDIEKGRVAYRQLLRKIKP
jgi:hypothetical protein